MLHACSCQVVKYAPVNYAIRSLPHLLSDYWTGIKTHSSPAAFSNNSDAPGASWTGPGSAAAPRKDLDGRGKSAGRQC